MPLLGEDRLGNTMMKSAGRRASGRFYAAWLLVILLDVLALIGASRLVYDDGLVRTFQSSNPHFERFERFQQTFPDQGADILLLLEGGGLARADGLLTVQDFVLDLSLSEGVASLVSPFSLRLSTPEGSAPLLQPTASMTEADLAAHLHQALDQVPDLGRVLSPQTNSMLVIVQSSTASDEALFEQIDGLAGQMLATHDIGLTQTGYTVMRASVIKRLFEDFVLLNVLGLVLGTAITAVALQSFVLAMLVSFSATTGLLWVLGAMGFAGVPINVITVALPVLILVLAFSDALHLSFETRRLAVAADPNPVAQSVRRVGPACVLASVTTAIAFAALTFSPSALVVQLGRTGAVAAMIAVAAVLIAHPLLHSTLGRFIPLPQFFTGSRGAPSRLARWSWLAGLSGRRPFLECLAAIFILAGSVLLYLGAPQSFSLYENTTEDQPSYRAIEQITQTFGPTGVLHYTVGLDPASNQSDLADAHQTLSDLLPDNEVLSLAVLSGQAGELPESVRERWLSSDGRTGLLTVTFDYRDSGMTRDLIGQIEERIALDPAAAALPLEPATGLEAMTAFVSQEMLLDMNRSFLVAVAASGLLIAVWLRDPLAGLVALVPNVLPIALVGAWLAITGQGLNFASAIALIIAFGLAIDDTLHVLNRLRLNLGGSIWAGRRQTLAAIHQVLPILVITSAVLSFGLLGTLWAGLPSIVKFGQLSIAVFILALVADLVVLPAFLTAVDHIRRRGEQ